MTRLTQQRHWIESCIGYFSIQSMASVYKILELLHITQSNHHYRHLAVCHIGKL